MKIKNVESLVGLVLVSCPSTRDNDDVLYYHVLKALGMDGHTTVEEFLLDTRKSEGYPPFETVRRTRQKLQAEFPDLQGTRSTKEKRKEAEEEFRAYAVS